jgi:pilus assembly protein CpaE
VKIAVISPSKTHLQEMARVLELHMHRVLVIEGGKTKMREVAEAEQPDIMLVDGMCCDPGELSLVEHITTHYPKIAVLLLCATHTPEFLINSMRAGVREVLPSPVMPSALEAAVARVAHKLAGLQGTPVGKVLAFMPCKGGSGATFLASNLGYQLSESRSVLLIDLNLQFGEALSFVSDTKPSSTLADISHDISRLDSTFLQASTVKVGRSFSILAAPDDPSKAMEVKAEHVDAILNLAVTQYEFVLLDLSRTLDTLTIRALDRAYRIYPVLQAGLPHLRNARKLLSVFKSLGYSSSKVEVIANRFEKTSEIGLSDIRRTLDMEDLRTIPRSDKEVEASINRGIPLVEMARQSPVARALAEFALSLGPKQEESPSIFDRLFRRA